jgi:signal transduction histidine kinase
LVAWTGLASAALYVNLSILGLFTSGPYLQFIVPLGLLWEMVFNGGGLLVKLDLIREERHTAKLREIELKGLGRLVRVVCHDISNPLMVVRFALDRIRSFNRTNGEPSALTDPLRLAEQGERAIEAVIEDVRAMEQLRATGGKLAVLPVDLAGLTREALAMFGSRTAEKKVTVLDSLPVSVMAFGIPGILVRSVIANILANAIKFTPEGSSITLQIETQPERVGLRITDTGPGIPAETLAALARAEPLASRLGSAGERGTGFGLQLAQDFATAMGGGLTFQVPAPGAATGTAVTIWLRAT